MERAGLGRMNIPASFALLLINGQWNHFSIPVPRQRRIRAGLGYSHVSGFIAGEVQYVQQVEPFHVVFPEAVKVSDIADNSVCPLD